MMQVGINIVTNLRWGLPAIEAKISMVVRNGFGECYTAIKKGAFMEQFEEDVSSHPFSDEQEYQGVEELESEAFNRGLPEKDMTPLPANEHGFSDLGQWVADDFESAAPIKASPVILLIDDEKPFRNVLKQVLSSAGYDVVEAANGEEGIETIIELKKVYPEVKLIVMSGGGWYGTDIDFDMAKKLGARTFDKPFALRELLDAIAELLN
jgi:ActR/RegA family two-component response regulator